MIMGGSWDPTLTERSQTRASLLFSRPASQLCLTAVAPLGSEGPIAVAPCTAEAGAAQNWSTVPQPDPHGRTGLMLAASVGLDGNKVGVGFTVCGVGSEIAVSRNFRGWVTDPKQHTWCGPAAGHGASLPPPPAATPCRPVCKQPVSRTQRASVEKVRADIALTPLLAANLPPHCMPALKLIK